MIDKRKTITLFFKVITVAAVAGAALIGVNHIFKNNSKIPLQNDPGSPQNEEILNGVTGVENTSNQNMDNETTGDLVVGGLKKTQDVTSKLMTLLQALILAGETITGLFNSGPYYSNQQYYVGPGTNAFNNPYNNPWVVNPNPYCPPQPGPIPGGPKGWRRVGENIIEAY